MFMVQQAVALAESWIDDDIDEEDAILWTNAFMRDELNSHFWTTDTQMVDAVAGTWYDLPVEFVKVESMKDVASGLFTRQYQISGRRIRFSVAGTYQMEYLALSTPMTSLTDYFPAHRVFLSPLAYFLAGSWWQKEDSTEPDGPQYMQKSRDALNTAMGNIQHNSFVRPRMRW